MFKPLFSASLVLLTVAAAIIRADEILFKSGDRLTGTVKSAADGKMVFESKVAGRVTLKMEDILTFSTEKPIDLEMRSGKKIKQIAVAQRSDGLIASAADATITFPLTEIAKINPPPVKWTGKSTVGATIIRGNSHNESATLAFETSRRTDKNRISFEGAYFFARQRDNAIGEDNTTEDNWFLREQYDTFISKKNYLFTGLKYEKNRIVKLDKRFTPSIGYGYQWIERGDMHLRTEIGGSWLYEKYEDPGESRTYLAGRLAYRVDKIFNKILTLYQNFENIPSLERSDVFLVNADIGLRAALTARWAIDFKSQLAYNSRPTDDKNKLDTRYISALAWTF